MEAFEIVTKVVESYSDKYIRDYFRVPTLAFLMAWFSKTDVCKKHAVKHFEK